MAHTYYIKSKSKTGRKPRTGNRYYGEYAYVEDTKERVFLLRGNKTKLGRRTSDIVAFNSPAAAMRAGWVVVA